MRQVPDSLTPDRPSLDRRDFLQLAATFGLTLTVPGFAAKAPAAPLTADEMKLIGEVSELIIPTTDTGGALAARVPDFVKMMLANWFSDAERGNFIAGMHEFTERARKKYGRDFGDLPAKQKDEYFGAQLAAAEAAPASTNGAGANSATARSTPFVVLMKRLTIFGYYTSELGATIELHQQMSSAQYVPAAVVKPGDRADSGLPPEQLTPGGFGIHEMGTARMGRDPTTSFLNGHNQSHEVANLFVTDGSCMASSAAQNPSLTYMALTARAASYAVQQMKSGVL